ncbi:MAG: PAS domain S-box protein [Methanoregula sp.]|jgi:PAS domain S-box-containing protein|nr:PAS domain S-box protein [Methanoregula sp.]
MDHEGRFTYVSPRLSRYGYIPDEVLSKNFAGFMAEEDLPVVMADVEKTVLKGIPAITRLEDPGQIREPPPGGRHHGPHC